MFSVMTASLLVRGVETVTHERFTYHETDSTHTKRHAATQSTPAPMTQATINDISATLSAKRPWKAPHKSRVLAWVNHTPTLRGPAMFRDATKRFRPPVERPKQFHVPPSNNTSPRTASDAPTLDRWTVRDHFYSTVSRILSLLAALLILLSEMMSSTANKNVLFGTVSPSEPAIPYSSPYMSQYLATLVSQPLVVQRMVQTIESNATSLTVFYLERSNTSSFNHGLVLQPMSCSPPSLVTDPLYDAAYIEPLLHHALSSLGDWSKNQYVFVDCSFDGRVLADTSTVKLYLVDESMTNFSTLVVQTMSVTRPTIRFNTMGGVAMLCTTPLKAMYVDPTTRTVSTTLLASYTVTFGFTFPYEWGTFDRITLDDLIPQTNGQWQATVESTGERFQLAGTTGVYRESPTVQASFSYFYWALPSDPVEFATTIQYINVYVRKDVRGWFRCFLGLGIGFNIAVNTLVSLVVVTNLWRTSRVIWIPDVFPAIQRRACARIALLCVDCAVNHMWYPYTYVLSQGGYRTNWVGTLFLEEIYRADGLMVCLACGYVITYVLRIRLKLMYVVGIYGFCFINRLWLVDHYGICPNEALKIIETDYLSNVIPGNVGGMELWAHHEDSASMSDRLLLFANEVTWLILAMGVTFGYALMTKIAVHAIAHAKNIAVSRRWITVHSVSHLSGSTGLSRLSQMTARVASDIAIHAFTPTVAPPTKVQPVDVPNSNILGKSDQRHWMRRSSLYDGMTHLDVDNTRVERCVGMVVGHMTGFVASTTDYVAEVQGDKTRVYVSLSGLWLLGFVVVNDRLLVAINDIVFLVLNIILPWHLVRVYGFALHGQVVAKRQHQIFPNDVQLFELRNLSLKTLR
ncbi:Aste57867_17097 [Aphanomyces stellatus]|uniref:Aste57867_17097 protein n=1 Tax=Aphanomyces stellatus TaxID=120398 RepID=A0A485L730_9STRA|nr:hypothetical protein As57867_017038 [Aphanomyces stellatus]VFT93855.1 Aste57867_17097 [Aphanomyces stellatus]